jgi:hypothetical protein
MKLVLLFVVVALPFFAADPWKVPHSTWTEEDARRILQSSPWVRPVPESHAIVRWESARPVQFAILKLQPAASVESCSGCYAIAIIGATNMDFSAASVATLKANGRTPIQSIETRVIRDAAIFVFPRREEVGQPILFRLPAGVKFGNTIEFETRIGSRILKQRFLPGKMTYEGRLEL